MIDREKLIKALEQHCDTKADCNSCPYEPEETSIKCRDSFLCDCLEALKQPQWISVKDRLPAEDEMVIGYTPVDRHMFVGFHKTYRYSWQDTAVCYWYILTARNSTRKMTKRVTHWMPLLEPPEGVMQDD